MKKNRKWEEYIEFSSIVKTKNIPIYGMDTNMQKKIKERKRKNEEDLQLRSNKNKDVIQKSGLFPNLLFILMLMMSIGYATYAISFGNNQIKQVEMIIESILLLILTIVIRIEQKKEGKIGSSICIIALLGFCLLTKMDIIKLPTNSVMKDFTNVSIEKALNWADANHITVEQVYDDSDTVEEYHIIKQNIYPNVLASSIQNVEFTVSSGPDYNKETVIPNMEGWNLEEVIQIIDDNFLNNVTIDFETSEETPKDVVIEQSRKGNMKRNDEMHLKISMGNEANNSDIAMEDLKNVTEFKATLWLKRNNIPYEITRTFSSKVKKGNVLAQEPKKGTQVNNSQKVKLTISRGKKIEVPDLQKMDQKEITKWIIQNRLKIEFIDRYDTKVKKGKVIEVSHKKKEIIEEGTTIKVTLSKGALVFPKFDSLESFRTWANRYNILFTEEYEQSKEIKQGEIIRFSVKEGDKIDPNENIVVTISSGETIVIPNFVGKKKNEIENTCKNLHLNCTFYYAGNTDKERDIAINQNKKAGSEVVKDTYVHIGLSSGKKAYNENINTGNTKPSGGGNQNSNGNNAPSPTPTPTPICETKNIYLGAGSTVNETKSIIQNQNPSFKFTFKTGDPGYGTIGSLYDDMFAKYHNKPHNTCNTITIYIVSR